MGFSISLKGDHQVEMSLVHTVKVLDNCHVSPPPYSVPPISLPLTFFDIPWLLCTPTERIFLYEFPHPTFHFTDNILPKLKHSLSLTLRHFFPLAGVLTCPPSFAKPQILYTEGNSVPLTIAESTGDFTHILGNYPRDAREFHPLVPKLTSELVRVSDDDDTQVISPLLALQVTIFPEQGISIGIKFCHVVADGMSSNHFMKSWAFMFKSKGGSLSSLPCYNRDLIKDPNGLETIFLKHWWARRSYTKIQDRITPSPTTLLDDKLRATLVISRSDTERLKNWILIQSKQELQSLHLSTFVVTCAFTWACLIKSKDGYNQGDDDEVHHFSFVADCRNRDEFLDVPVTYFGNCLAGCHVSAKKGELVGENGVVVAAKLIRNRVRELKSGLLRGADKWLSDYEGLLQSGNLVSVAGSPKLCVYDTDFGWGRPRKTEVVHIDKSGSISLAECRDEKGGVEVGLALPKVEMEAFISLFEQGLKVVG